MVGGWGDGECDERGESCWFNTFCCVCAGSMAGACEVHGAGTGGADGMRGDGVGVGDIGTVPGDAGRSGDAAGGDDGGGAGRERDTSVVGGRGDDERD